MVIDSTFGCWSRWNHEIVIFAGIVGFVGFHSHSRTTDAAPARVSGDTDEQPSDRRC